MPMASYATSPLVCQGAKTASGIPCHLEPLSTMMSMVHKMTCTPGNFGARRTAQGALSHVAYIIATHGRLDLRGDMTVKQFKKENQWGYYPRTNNCNCCHHRSIVFVPMPVTDMRGHEWTSGVTRLVCRACGSHGFNTYVGCWCKAWEGQHEN